jgi:hypothetical protein
MWQISIGLQFHFSWSATPDMQIVMLLNIMHIS